MPIQVSLIPLRMEGNVLLKRGAAYGYDHRPNTQSKEVSAATTALLPTAVSVTMLLAIDGYGSFIRLKIV